MIYYDLLIDTHFELQKGRAIFVLLIFSSANIGLLWEILA